MIDKLVEECIENIDEVKVDNENEHKKECSSCIVCIVLFSIILEINIGNWYLLCLFSLVFKKDIPRVEFDTIYWTYKWGKRNK